LKIIVTGSSGFIGGQLVTYFAAKGYQVLALQRAAPASFMEGVEFQSYDLSAPLNTSKFGGANYLIHTACQPYSRRNAAANSINFSGTADLVDACKKAGIKIIFLSTFSAHDRAESNYGKTKLQLENIFDHKRDLVLKLGLVLGDGGLFDTIVNIIESHRFVPITGQSKLIQTVAMRDLLSLIEVGMKKEITGSYPVGETNPIPLRTLYKAIAIAVSKKPLFIPVPLNVILILCFIAEIAGIKLPITTENVLGVKRMRSFETEEALKPFGFQPSPYYRFLDNLERSRH